VTLMRLLVELAKLVRVFRWLNLSSAFKLLMCQWSSREYSLRVRGYKWPISVRGKSTDSWVLRSIIVDEEYGGFVSFVPTTIIDAGANIGLASVYFKSCFPNAAIVALEPDADNYRMAKLNLDKYPNVELLHAGIWSKDVLLKLENPGDWKYAIRVVEDDRGDIPALSVSSIIERRGWDHLDVLKLDVEGAEAAVFSEGVDSWINKINVIIVELHQAIAPNAARLLCGALARRDFHLRWRGEDLVATRIPLLGH
jgi:FkbM family methyltransferase